MRSVLQSRSAPPADEIPGKDERPSHCCRLSEELERILALTDGGDLAVRDVVARLGTRGHALLAFLFALPFLQPVPLVGLSTPVGFAIAILGLFMALGKPPWLPAGWMERTVPARHVRRIVGAGQRLLARAERFIRPRGQWFHRRRWARPIAGAIIAISGAQLALPLPIVFTNTLPALVIATTAAGLLEEDALLTLLGMGLFLLAAGVFTFILLLPWLGLRALL